MPKVEKHEILNTTLTILTQLMEDWDFSGEITPQTFFVADLALESIDIVVISETIQNHYQYQMPFAQFLAEIGQREIRDIRIDEFVEFVYTHLNCS